MNIFKKISSGLGKTREKMRQSLKAVFSPGDREEQLEMLEELLLLADVGPKATAKIVQALETQDDKDLFSALREKLYEILDPGERPLADSKVKIFVGINGTGKTTTVGKYIHMLAQEGKKTFVIGADTFRAAADMQLEEWCKRTKVPFIVGKPGSDPASVVYDGLNSSQARAADIVICDTAGRLHVNKNLMQELEKLVRVANKVAPDSVEVMLTLDAGMGQNALEQMAVFGQWVKPTGIVLTKLDGSARGGVAIALAEQFGVPIRYIGVGEGLDDLVPFDHKAYVDSLLPEDLE